MSTADANYPEIPGTVVEPMQKVLSREVLTPGTISEELRKAAKERERGEEDDEDGG